MQEYTILYRGAAVATLQGDFIDNLGGGDLRPLPAFDAVRHIVADASRALTNHGFLPPIGAFAGGVSAEGSRAGDASLRAAEDVFDEMELRDAQGRFLLGRLEIGATRPRLDVAWAELDPSRVHGKEP